MGLVRQSIPSLYGGVSQQAAVVRNPNQCDHADNAYFSVSHGVSKRPPLECLNEITGVNWGTAFHHFAQRADGSWFLYSAPGDGTLDVYRLTDGSEINVTLAGSVGAYLTTTGSARDVIRAYTVGDVTYIVNTEVQVAMTASTTAGSIAGTAQSLQDDALNSAANDSIWHILGDADTPTSGYYAKKVSGKWFEWVKPGIEDELDPATMPVIVTLSDDEIDPLGVVGAVDPVEWAKCLVGDEKSNKQPSFVGQRMSGIYFASDRLGFLAANGTVLSETGEHHNFWRTTVVDVIDSDRIDITNASDDATTLRWALPLARSVLILSEARQFTLDWQGLLSPRTASMTQATAYPAASGAKPVNVGPTAYFTSQDATSSQLMEMYLQEDAVTFEAANNSSHAPTWVPKGVFAMAAHANLNLIAMAHKDTYAGSLSIYQYYWSGQQKVQSAWSRWSLQGVDEVLAIQTIGDYLYVVYQREASLTNKVMIGRINLRLNDPGQEAKDAGFGVPVHLDQRQLLTGTYDAPNDRTIFTCTYPVMESAGRLQLVSADVTTQGRVVRDGPTWSFNQPDLNNPHTFTVNGDHSAHPWYVGLYYQFAFYFSQQFYTGGGNAPSLLNGRTQLRYMSVSYADTAAFRVQVFVRGGAPYSAQVITGPELEAGFTSRTLGDDYWELNSPYLNSGTHRFPVYCRTEDATILLVNDTHMPCHFQTAEWEALVHTRTSPRT